MLIRSSFIFLFPLGWLCSWSAPVLAAFPAQPSYCKLPEINTKPLYSFPKGKGQSLESVAWLAKPVPNQIGRPFLIAYAQFAENGFEKTYFLDLASGSQMTIPGHGDAITSPDGKFVTLPGMHSNGKGLTFFQVQPLIDGFLKSKKDLSQLQPIFNDVNVGGYCQSIGLIHTKENKTLYRILHAGGGPFQLTEYETTEESTGLKVERKATLSLCPNLPYHQEGSAVLSKDGRYVALYDSQASSTKIFEIEIQEEKSKCTEVVDLGIPTGRLDFSFDNKRIAFHVTFLDVDYVETLSLGVPATKIKDVMVAELKSENGKITGVGRMARLTHSPKRGEGSYLPGFLPNGMLYYVHQDNSNAQGKGYRFEVVDPNRLKFEPNFFTHTETEEEQKNILLKVMLGKLWTRVCQGKPLSPNQSALYAMSLEKEACKQLVEKSWENSKNILIAEFKNEKAKTPAKFGKIQNIFLEHGLNRAILLRACGELN